MSSKERELTRFFDEDGQPNNQDVAKADEATNGNAEEFPNKVGVNKEDKPVKSTDGRVRYSRLELLEKFVEVEQPTRDLITNLKDNKIIGLGKHIISNYTIRPVACDKFPFNITHENPYNNAMKQKQQYRPRFHRDDKQQEEVIKIPKNLSVEE